MSKEIEREPFDVTEESFDAILNDVEAESDTPPEESSPLDESVELTDAVESEADETIVVETEEPETAEDPDKTEEETEPEKVEEAREAEKPDSELLVEKDGKTYDFTSAPKEMREVVKSQNRLVNAFVRDNIEAVQTELRNLSPSSYEKLEQTIINKSATVHPDKWSEFLVTNNPKIVMNALLAPFADPTDADGLKDADPKLIAELYRVFREESEEGEELRTLLELRSPEFGANPLPKLTPAEKAELEELRREKQQQSAGDTTKETQKVYEEVFDYVDTATIMPIVKQFGLMPEASDSPEVTREKRRVVNSLAGIIDTALQEDPSTADDYRALLVKIEARDKAGAMAILPALQQKMEEEAISYLSFIKNSQTASLKQKHTAAKKPPTALAAAGSIVPPVSKPVTLAERLETQSDEDFLRAMGI